MRKTKLRMRETTINGERYFVVIYPGMDGKRQRDHFKNRGEAKTFHDKKRVELANFGTAAAALDERQRAEYLECRDILKPFGLSLRDAVNKLLPQLKAEKTTSLVSKTMEKFLQAKESDGLSSRYLKDLKNRLKQFSKNLVLVTWRASRQPRLMIGFAPCLEDRLTGTITKGT